MTNGAGMQSRDCSVRIRIVPNHACGLANMHDELVAIDGERVVDIGEDTAQAGARRAAAEDGHGAAVEPQEQYP